VSCNFKDGEVTLRTLQLVSHFHIFTEVSILKGHELSLLGLRTF